MKWFGVIQKKTTQLLVHGGSAAVNRGADFVQHRDWATHEVFMKSNNFRLQIAIAIIGLVGIISTAVISNWDKLFYIKQHSKIDGKPLSQSSVGTNSPNVANVQGNVNIDINEKQPQLNIPSFNHTIDSSAQATDFQEFIDENRGKIVHINLISPDPYSKISNFKQGTYFYISSKPCYSEFFSECLIFGLKINGDDYILEWYKGDNRMTGFFAIEENVWMHQGIYYILKAVPRETVLLQTQRTP